MSKHHTNKFLNRLFAGIVVSIVTVISSVPLPAQSRILYNNRQLFLSGSNIAWVSFARDIGPDNTNFNTFRTIFDSVHANHGNSMRFWLHTNGQSSPSFNINGYVNGPGTNTISDLKTILDLAWERKVGLLLCLWSFDMLQNNNSASINNRNRLMLNDTVYLQAYIDSALIPMVSALKSHPAIIAWEVFNEAEGMSTEYGWPDLTSADIPMATIQRFVNKVAGAIHRTDSTAKVTTGAWAFKVLTDVTPLTKRASIQSILQSMTTEEKTRIENEFTLRYNAKVSAENIITRFNADVQDQNYYRNDRLIASGGDPLGTLDFYTVHYYSWAGTALSPFHHPSSYWQLDKPIAVAEFFLENTFGILYKYLYRNLFDNGYAGALTWQWIQNDAQQPRTKEAMNNLFSLYPDDVDVTQSSGKIYSFTASPSIVDRGDSTVISWTTSKGSSSFLDGNPVPIRGIKTVAPMTSTEFTLNATGATSETSKIAVKIYPTGTIIYFKAVPVVIAEGESAMIYWRTAKRSQTTLDGNAVSEYDSIRVTPKFTTFYRLNTQGDTSTTSQIMVNVIAPEMLNRASLKPITVVPDDSASSPSAINDNFFDSQWTSASVSSIKILIDLQQILTINKILLSWGTNYCVQYRIVISTDGINWTQMKQIVNGTGGEYTHDSLNYTCRYFWLQLDKRFSTASGYNLNELQLFGTVTLSAINPSIPDIRPTVFHLSECYPNPFNPSASIEFTIPSDGETTLKVYTILGKEVATLYHNVAKSGVVHRIYFTGDFLASGTYLARLEWNGRQTIRKLILLR